MAKKSTAKDKDLRVKVKKLQARLDQAEAKADRWKSRARKAEAAAKKAEKRAGKLTRRINRTSGPAQVVQAEPPAVASTGPDESWTVAALWDAATGAGADRLLADVQGRPADRPAVVRGRGHVRSGRILED